MTYSTFKEKYPFFFIFRTLFNFIHISCGGEGRHTPPCNCYMDYPSKCIRQHQWQEYNKNNLRTHFY